MSLPSLRAPLLALLSLTAAHALLLHPPPPHRRCPPPSMADAAAGATESSAAHGLRSSLPLREPCNVVLTHTNADFDSLAAAVALAKLWRLQRPSMPTHVVLPRGANPLAARFLAYHKHLFPIRGFSTINPEEVQMIGVCDTQTRDRLGPAAAWLENATHIAVFDHHEYASTDLEPDELLVEPVGSTTTLLVEKLKASAPPPEHVHRAGWRGTP
ncbi:hypothetical protein AB1Y20_007192 [Prymnesium parvum]|uniref:DDH domain-containing protein n=1 Tax=Prymnesium parvum TaxID=97485 RepID=A0AB34IUK2_PRYPA